MHANDLADNYSEFFQRDLPSKEASCSPETPKFKESFKKNKVNDGHCYNSTCKEVSHIEAKTKQKTTHPELGAKSSIPVHQIGAETKNFTCSSSLIKIIKQDFKNYQKF